MLTNKQKIQQWKPKFGINVLTGKAYIVNQKDTKNPGGKRGGINWEIGIDILTLPYIK